MDDIVEYTPSGLPVRKKARRQYKLTERDKEYLKGFAVNGTMPFDDYIWAMNHLPDDQNRRTD